jgi:hypothetical protein
MIIAGIELIPLRIPVNAGSKSHASPWGRHDRRVRARTAFFRSRGFLHFLIWERDQTLFKLYFVDHSITPRLERSRRDRRFNKPEIRYDPENQL